jgi:hypothetical protein
MDSLADCIRGTGSNSVVLGNFNLPGIDWRDWTATSGWEKQFLQACEDVGMEQFVDFATQKRGNTLDLILTNMPEKVVDVREVGRLGKSNHVMIQASINISMKETKTTETVPNWARADWASIREGLRGKDWRGTLGEGTVSSAWGLFKKMIADLVKKHVPTKPRRAPNKPVWLKGEVTKALRRQRRLWKRAMCGPEEMQRYKEAEKQATKAVRNAKRNFEKRLAKEKRKNSKPFYAYLKGKTKSRTAVGPLKDKGGNLVNTVKRANIVTILD